MPLVDIPVADLALEVNDLFPPSALHVLLLHFYMIGRVVFVVHSSSFNIV